MLEWLQMMKLAAGQSDHQCCFFLSFFFKILLTTESGKLFMTFVKVLLETQRLAAATVQACGMCEYAKLPYVFFVLFFHARFQHENVKLFGNLLPCRAFIERSHIELSSARMFDATSLVEHMPHSVLGRLFAWWLFFFFFFPQSCSSGHGEEGLVRDSSCPVLCEHYDMYDLAKNTRSAKTYK